MKQQNKWEKLFDEFLDLTEFTLVRHQNDWSLIDNQGGNLGDIQSDRFNDAAQILERMDVYIHDYIIEDIEDLAEENNIDISDWDGWGWDYLLSYRDKFPQDCQYEFDLLDMICFGFEEINLENCTYEEVEEMIPKDKIMIAVLDDGYYTKHHSYPEEYHSRYAHKTYVFDTPQEFIEKWYELDGGIWYWVFDKGNIICSGAVDENDLETFEEYFNIKFEEEC
jgi:hypothetical protein